jgi:hypothetical protein
MKTLLVVGLSALLAPYQCASGKQSERPVEDSAPKALSVLAERFRSQGDQSACETVQQQLIEQYPSSRYAKQAREHSCLGGAPRSAVPSAQAAHSTAGGDRGETAAERGE